MHIITFHVCVSVLVRRPCYLYLKLPLIIVLVLFTFGERCVLLIALLHNYL